ITIEKAEAWNLVAETVDASIFEKYRNRLLGSVASRSQFSIFAMKKLMQLEGTTHYCDAWAKLGSDEQTNEDFVEGRSAFMETRPPEFDWNINNGSRLLSRTTEVQQELCIFIMKLSISDTDVLQSSQKRKKQY